MKPLELQIFEKHPDMDAYKVGASFTPYAIMAREVRFTDAELAAEYWKVMSGLYDGHGKAARERRYTLERFHALPHFDEEV